MAFSMLFFGWGGYSSNSRDTYALKVNDTEVSFAEFEQRKQERTAQLIQALGPNYAQFASQLLEGMNQRIIDELIEETLLQETAKKIGLAPGKDFIPKLIQKFFPNGYSPESYRAFLSRIGSTAPAFEDRIARETLAMQLRGLLKQVSAVPPPGLVKALYEQEERQYSLAIATFSPEEMEKGVEAPSEEEIEEYYQENMIDYELPPRVRLSYATVKPEAYKKNVEVLDEDIELYYIDNEKEFRTPEQVKVKEISLNVDSSDIAAKVGTESLAEELYEKVQNGEPLEALAAEYSDDSRKGKVSTWIVKGSQGDDFDSELFGEKVEVGKQALIKTPSKIRIVELVEKKEAGLMPLEAVKETIAVKIRDREAPIYAAEKARELFDQWEESGEDLSDFAGKNDLPVEKVEELTSLDGASDSIRPLVKDALDFSGEKKLLVDMGNSLALVFVDEFRDSEIPQVPEIKEKIVKNLVASKAIERARSSAEEVFASANPMEKESLEKVGAKFESLEGKKASELVSLPFTSSEVKQAVLKQRKTGKVGNAPFEVNGKQYVVAVTNITEPDLSQFEEKAPELEKESSQRLAMLLEQSLISHLKANNEIDVHPATFER